MFLSSALDSHNIDPIVRSLFFSFLDYGGEGDHTFMHPFGVFFFFIFGCGEEEVRTAGFGALQVSHNFFLCFLLIHFLVEPRSRNQDLPGCLGSMSRGGVLREEKRKRWR